MHRAAANFKQRPFNSRNSKGTTMNTKPHKHAEVIKAWADGAEVQMKRNDGVWVSVSSTDTPLWLQVAEYRVKPAEPERKYPETTMTGPQLAAIFEENDHVVRRAQPMRAVANAALRLAIDSGQVFVHREFNYVVEDRRERDIRMAVAGAKEMYNKIYCNLPHRQAFCDIVIDYGSIVSGVKP
jgi:hypothetical protein